MDPSGHRDSGKCGPGEDCDNNGKKSKVDLNKTGNMINEEKATNKLNQFTKSDRLVQHTIISQIPTGYSPDSFPWEINADKPDYVAYTVNFEFVSSMITIDRYQNFYVGFGGNVGKLMFIFGFSKIEGTLFPKRVADEKTLQNFLQGPSTNVSCAALIGKASNTPLQGDIISSDENLSYAIPQVSLSIVHNILIIDNKKFGY